MFEGKVAIVTGGARGLGRDYAEYFAADGASVVVADLDADGAAATAKALVDKGATARAVGVDITDEASALELVADTVGAFGGVDFLVNNAALWGDLEHMAGGVLDNPVDYFRRVVDVNLTGTFIASKAVAPAMPRAEERTHRQRVVDRGVDVRRSVRDHQARAAPAHVRMCGAPRRRRHHGERSGAGDDLQRGDAAAGARGGVPGHGRSDGAVAAGGDQPRHVRRDPLALQ